MNSDPLPLRVNRPKRSWIVAIGVILGTIALWVGWFGLRRHREQAAVKAWEDFKTQAEASGDSFAWDPFPHSAPIPDDQNFFGHPWIVAFVASRANPSRSFIDSLESSRDANYEPIHSGESWLEEHPEAAAPTLAIGRTHETDLTGLREAAARPGISLAHFDSIEMERLGKISPPLALHAEAALITGDAAAATADLEALVHIGKHLHKIPSMMALIVAAGFEGRAVEVIKVGLKTDRFSVEQRHRLASACRSTAIGPAIATAMRSERGAYLTTLDRQSLPAGISIRREPLLDSWGRFSARASLTYCELLQPGLAPAANSTTWGNIAAESLRLLHDKKIDPAIGFAGACLNATVSTVPQILIYDEDLQKVRRQLAE